MQSFASLLMIAISFITLSFSAAWARGNFDGPAELPRIAVASSMADTPAPGSIIAVRSGGNLQAALDNAFCGDTIELQAGAIFSGRFLLRAKNCDSGHWIVIRTSAANSLLPSEGQRVTPCYAGVASLPGRPQYACVNRQNVMARIENNTTTDGPFMLRTGANHYRLIGLEITTRHAVTTSTDYALVEIGADPKTGKVEEWASPGGPESHPYGIASTSDGIVWYSESGVKPNTLVAFDPETKSFKSWPIPSGGGVVRNMVATPDDRLYLACSGVNKVAIAQVK